MTGRDKTPTPHASDPWAAFPHAPPRANVFGQFDTSRPSGLFDDLIPRKPAGRFDDLIPSPPAAGASSGDPWATFPDAPPRANVFDQFDTPRPSGASAAPPPDLSSEAAIAKLAAARDSVKPASEPSLVDRIMGTVDMAGRGVAKGAMNMIGLPRSLMELQRQGSGWLMRKVGVPEETIDTAMKYGFPLADILPNSEKMQQGLDRANEATADFLGIRRPNTVPRNAAETISQRVGEEIGAMAVPTAGILAKAAGTTAQAAREGGRLSRLFIEPAIVNPGGFVGRELRIAAGAGGGAGVANTLVDRETTGGQVADLVGALTGAGVTGLATATGRGVANTGRALSGSPGYIDNVVRDEVTDRLAEASGLQRANRRPVDTQELVDIIRRGPRVGETIPGVVESLADRTGNVGIASLEYSRQSGPNAGAFAQRRTDNEQAIARAIGANEPGGNPAALRSELDLRRQTELSAAADRRAAAAAEADSAAQRVQPSSPYAEDRGAAVRASLENAERAARETERQAWEGIRGQLNPVPLAVQLEQTRGTLPIARQQVVRDVDQAIDIPAMFARPATPPTPSPILAADGNPIMRPGTPAAGEMPLEELTALRSRLATEQRNAGRGPQPDRNRAEAIGRYVSDVDNFMSGALPPETLTQAALARGVSRNVNERFNRPNDPIMEVLSRREGRPDVPDSAVARRFVQPDTGQAGNIDRLLAETDLSSRAVSTRQGVRDEILADIQKRGLAGKPEELDRYLASHSRVFDRFPDLRDELAGVAGSARSAREATSAEAGLQRELGTADRRGEGTVGKFLAYGDAQSDRAMRDVMASRDPAKAADDLLTYASERPEALQGAQQAFWNVMKAETTPAGHTTRNIDGRQPWNPTRLKDFLSTPANRAVAARLWKDNPEHLHNVEKIAQAAQTLDTRNAGKARNASGTAQSILPSAETLSSRVFAYKRGQVGGAYLLTSMMAVMGRRAVKGAQANSIDRVLDDALLNPELAALLLKENNPANRAAIRRWAKLWFGNDGGSVINAMSADEEEEDPVKRALAR